MFSGHALFVLHLRRRAVLCWFSALGLTAALESTPPPHRVLGLVRCIPPPEQRHISITQLYVNAIKAIDPAEQFLCKPHTSTCYPPLNEDHFLKRCIMSNASGMKAGHNYISEQVIFIYVNTC